MTEGTRKLRSAVIGCGAISKSHLDYLSKSEHTELIGLCDRSQALSEAASIRYGGVSVFTNHKEMLRALVPDVIHILTPPESHDALTRDVLAAGVHVICEKPMTDTAENTTELLGLARAAGLSLVETCNLKFFDPVIALRAKIDSGILGEIRECDILLQLDFLSGSLGDCNLSGPAVNFPAGAVHDFLPHLAYLFLYLSDATQIDAVVGKIDNLSGNRRAVFDFLDTLIFAGNKRGRLRFCADVGPAAFKVVIRGTAATVETDLYNPFLSYAGPPEVGKRAPFGQIREGLRQMLAGCRNLHAKIGLYGADYGMGQMLESCYEALRDGRAPPIDPQDMIATARLCDRLVALRVSQ